MPAAAVRVVGALTLIIAGDRDIARLEHAIELSRLFPDARLLVLPSGHGDYLAEASTSPADTDYAEITAGLLDRFSAEHRPHQRTAGPHRQLLAFRGVEPGHIALRDERFPADDHRQPSWTRRQPLR